MDPLTRLMGRISLLYLGAGFVLGALLMISEGTGAGWGRAWGEVHAHILFVGWFVQFAIGIGYWLLPRRKTPERPYGYNTSLAYTACALINAGLLLRVIIEPLFITGNLGGSLAAVLLGLSGILQAAAGLIWAYQLWQRFFLRYSASNRPVKDKA
ncbi:MAG TPA: hypothetical protein VH186_07140 [Chloroflexia bacterium]|nr:hypothetical protein [Chloroflexia bacterium]